VKLQNFLSLKLLYIFVFPKGLLPFCPLPFILKDAIKALEKSLKEKNLHLEINRIKCVLWPQTHTQIIFCIHTIMSVRGFTPWNVGLLKPNHDQIIVQPTTTKIKLQEMYKTCSGI